MTLNLHSADYLGTTWVISIGFIGLKLVYSYLINQIFAKSTECFLLGRGNSAQPVKRSKKTKLLHENKSQNSVRSTMSANSRIRVGNVRKSQPGRCPASHEEPWALFSKTSGQNLSQAFFSGAGLHSTFKDICWGT
jgi:hypothetical protein